MTGKTTCRMAVVTGLLFLMATGNVWAKNQVPRPFKIRACSTAVVNAATGSYEARGHGVATHLGRYIVQGWGIWGGGAGGGAGHGVFTAANGDRLYYEDTPAQVTFTGGTGRFQGASGGFTFVVEPVGPPIVDPVAGTITMSFRWKGRGTITY